MAIRHHVLTLLHVLHHFLKMHPEATPSSLERIFLSPGHCLRISSFAMRGRNNLGRFSQNSFL